MSYCLFGRVSSSKSIIPFSFGRHMAQCQKKILGKPNVANQSHRAYRTAMRSIKTNQQAFMLFTAHRHPRATYSNLVLLSLYCVLFWGWGRGRDRVRFKISDLIYPRTNARTHGRIVGQSVSVIPSLKHIDVLFEDLIFGHLDTTYRSPVQSSNNDYRVRVRREKVTSSKAQTNCSALRRALWFRMIDSSGGWILEWWWLLKRA